MKLKDFKKFCLSFNGTSENYPFDDDNILAINVMDEVFAITDTDNFESIEIKCDPVKAAMLRDLYEEVQPAAYMDKRHWNTIYPNEDLDDELIKEWIKDSYSLVVDSLARKKQKKLEKMED